jgi:hypothetical protein
MPPRPKDLVAELLVEARAGGRGGGVADAVMLAAALLQGLDACREAGPGRVALAHLGEHLEGALVVARLLEQPRLQVEGRERHVLVSARRDQLVELVDRKIDVALVLVGLGQPHRRLGIVRVGDAHLGEELDGAGAIALVEGHLRRLEDLALLAEGLHPARHVARLREALDRAVIGVGARVGVARAQQLARRAVHLGGALVVARLLVEQRRPLVLGQRLAQRRRLVRQARRLVVVGRLLTLALVLVEAREQHARDLVLAVALERPGRRRHVARQVGLHGGRTAGEEQGLALGQVDPELDGLEALDVQAVLGHAIGAAHDECVLSAIQGVVDGAAHEAHRAGDAASRDLGLLDRALVPHHAHLHRAGTRMEVELDARGAAPLDPHLPLREVGGDDVFTLAGLEEAVDVQVVGVAGDVPEVGLARHLVVLGPAREAGARTGALCVLRVLDAAAGVAGRLAGGESHREGAAQLRRVVDAHHGVAATAQEPHRGQPQEDRHRHAQRDHHLGGAGQAPGHQVLDAVTHQARCPDVGGGQHGAAALGDALQTAPGFGR